MEKFLITRKSQNRKTGPILLTTSPRNTCPTSCPLRKNAKGNGAGSCYAEHGMLGGFLWSKLDQLPVGGSFKLGQIVIRSIEDLSEEIGKLPIGAVWRHNQAGDLPSDDNVNINADRLRRLIKINTGRRGFTYTHFDVLENQNNRSLVAEANTKGFIINLSANSPSHADQLCRTQCGPVTTLLPEDARGNTKTPNGRKIVICPAVVQKGANCANCQLCARQRTSIIGFPTLQSRRSNRGSRHK